jgi:transcriptional regulator with XRE-family HTH domain
MNETRLIINYSGKPTLGVISCVVESSYTIESIQHFGIQWKVKREIILMTPQQTVQLINLLAAKRKETGLSVNEVARRAEVDVGTVWRIEQGRIPTPKAESLKAIGRVLNIPAIDLFAIVGWIPSGELPSFGPYLRAKYPQLPAEASEEIEAQFEAVSRRHGVHESEDTLANPAKG